MSQYQAEITWRCVRAHVTNGNEEANRLADEASRRCDHDDLIQMLELQAKASKILIGHLQRGLSVMAVREIVDCMVVLNADLNMKLQNDYGGNPNYDF